MAYIASRRIITFLWLQARCAAEKPLMKHRITTANIAKLNKLLPKILPIHRDGLSISTVADMLVKSSGKEVMAESNTPPKNAPESLVVRSIISIYREARIENHTTAAAVIM